MTTFDTSLTMNPRRTRRLSLLMTSLAMVIVYILWNAHWPIFDVILYPLRLFVTYIHEAGHSLAALLTGGEIRGFLVSADGSGLATTAGGWRWVILPAGYLGAAAFGSLLFYAINRYPRHTRTLGAALGFGIVLFSVLYAIPDDQTGIPIALFVGGAFGLALMFMGLRLPLMLNLVVLNVLAVMTALNAVLDLWFLMRFIDASRGTVQNDAVAFSRDVLPIVPPSLVALIWAGLAVLMFGAAVWYGVIKTLRQEIDITYDALVSR